MAWGALIARVRNRSRERPDGTFESA
jgi:hypothetical protein